MISLRADRVVLFLSIAGFSMFGAVNCGDSGDGDSPPVEPPPAADATDSGASADKRHAERLRAELTPDRKSPLDPTLAGEIAFLAVETGDSETQDVVAFAADGTRLGNVTEDDHIKLDLSYSPATKRVLYVARHESRPARFDLHVMNVDGSDRINVTLEYPTPEKAVYWVGRGVGGKLIMNRSPSWGPNGATVYFATRKEGSWSFARISAEGGKAPDILWTPGDGAVPARGNSRLIDHPQVAPDGKFAVCVQRLPGTGDRIALLDLGAELGGGEEWGGFIQFQSGESPQTPRFSPDGKRVLYSVYTFKTNETNLFIADTAEIQSGKADPRYIMSGPRAMQVRWKPSGTTLLIAGKFKGGQQIYELDLEGELGENAEPACITNTEAALYSPVWVTVD